MNKNQPDMKYQKFHRFFLKGLICLLMFAGGEYAKAFSFNDNNANPTIEALLVQFYYDHIADYDFSDQINIPKDEEANYCFLLSTGSETYSCFIIKSEGVVYRVFHNLNNTDIALQAGRMMAGAGFRHNPSALDLASIGLDNKREEIFLFTIPGSSGKDDLLEQAFVVDYFKNITMDVSRIQDEILSLPENDTRLNYQSALNELVLKSALINQYRQRIWNDYNLDLALNLDRAINNSLPGVKTREGEVKDEVLARNVIEYILGESIPGDFDKFINSTVRKRVEARTRYDIDNNVRNIMFQIDYILKDIQKWREKINLYGACSSCSPETNVAAYRDLISMVPVNDLKKSSEKPYEFPENVSLLLAEAGNFQDNITPPLQAQQSEEVLMDAVKGDEEKVEKIIQIEEKEEKVVGPEKEIQEVSEQKDSISVIQDEIKETISVEDKKEAEPEVFVEDELPEVQIIEEATENPPVYDLEETISKGIDEEFVHLVESGYDVEMSNEYGGNIYHVINGRINGPEAIRVLKENNYDINKKDDYGNTPLHYALLTGNDEYAINLIGSGADVNSFNNHRLTPLHIAALFNDEELVSELIKSNANVNLKGNTGYTPLHIASELNFNEIAKELLLADAKKSLKTDQDLKAITIAKIQANSGMKKVLKKNGKYSAPSTVNYSPYKTEAMQAAYPVIDFDLAYNPQLVRMRKTNQTIQRISFPMIAATAVAATLLKLQANDYYDRYQNAMVEEEARDFYNKTNQFDTYALVSVSVSAVSLYGFIHSTIRKNRATREMYKPFSR